MKILPDMYLWRRKIPLNFGMHTHPDRNDLRTENFNFAALFIVDLCIWQYPLPAAVRSYL